MSIDFQDYQILSRCNGNGVNKIYVVRHKTTEKQYIIKIIPKEDEEKQIREIKVHWKLNHKYVIKMVDFEIKENSFVLQIEYAKYGDLY